ncbi:MAG TPA: pyruvate, phosphate dikinase [Thermoplasmata archaeon]|nr:pyruvate, phosphate dikinase [Thermoplasmata archaeon]
MPKHVYLFSEGNAEMRDLLGGKGAGLAEMTRLGLPVPPGFTITTKACVSSMKRGKFPPGLRKQVFAALATVEQASGKRFGDAANPLLVSVRSGSKFSMPGMMDTVLNLGLNAKAVEGLAHLSGDRRAALDAYRRLLSMFGRIVKGIEAAKFEDLLTAHKRKAGAARDTDLDERALEALLADYRALYRAAAGEAFPEDPRKQLLQAIEAVFRSWNGKRAVDYRNAMKIPHDLGTAANVQAMVFGNLGEDSGTGVVFTRDPATGERRAYGEYLANAQGEDVVAGIRTPMRIAELEAKLPDLYAELAKHLALLERHYKDVQDVEFTVERGKLYVLQTRAAKRTAAAAVRIAVDMVREGLVSREEAILRVDPQQVYQLLLPRFDDAAKEEAHRAGKFLAKGLNASPGAATGVAILHPDRAEELGRQGKPVILVRQETSPDDVHGMLHSKGILTSRGGATSHAAVVARGLGLPCVAGCEAITVDYAAGEFRAGERIVREGEPISLDGATGEVFQGLIPTVQPAFEEQRELQEVLSWGDGLRRLQVWANADYPRDARVARRHGAQGIGLCRTEHMFFEPERLPLVREMILARNRGERQPWLDRLLPLQRADFLGIFREMGDLPVVIRLLDPPLHEFLPKYEELIEEVAKLKVAVHNPDALVTSAGTEADRRFLKEVTERGEGDVGEGIRRLLPEKERLLAAVAREREQNPMLGLRGCRLGITMPEVTEMQVRAIFEAACALKKEGVDVHPEVMIPLVGHVNELRHQRMTLEPVARQVMEEQGVQVAYKVGTMIEVPRAALTAGEIAEHAEFFSFGTNDLTQMGFGYSRDDAEGKFLLKYVDMHILPENPFQVLDRDGIGQLMRLAVERGRKARPDLKVGICGEHGGDPESIEFCDALGLMYVSCSPYRVPVARHAAAQATVRSRGAGSAQDK